MDPDHIQRTAPEPLRHVIGLSREEYQEASATNYDKVVIGIATFKSSAGGSSVLLVQRSPHEEYYPNNFELPGGKVDPEDASILAAVCRELLEETGLQAVSVLAKLSDITYTTEKKIETRDGSEGLLQKSALQLNFV